MKRFGFRPNQRVVIVKNGEPGPHDQGRILRFGLPEGHEQIAIASDALGGKEVIFEFSWLEKAWRDVFHDHCAVAGARRYDEGKAQYLIEGLD
mgnify:CR=1 FL=1